MIRKEHGIYTFRTPPAHFGQQSGWYRTQMERGDLQAITNIIRMPESSESCFDYVDYDKLQMQGTWETEILNPRHKDHWMAEPLSTFKSHTLRRAMKVYDSLGKERIRRDYCPVCWCRAGAVVFGEMTDKVAYLVEQSGRKSIPLYFLAVSDESRVNYNISAPVLWMPYSFLRSFQSGVNLINVYRMMVNAERVYDIPACPYGFLRDNEIRR